MSKRFSIKETLGLSFPVKCGVCSRVFDHQVDPPITGRCGHTICAKCLQDFVMEQPVNDGTWQPCPYGCCSNLYSFEVTGVTTGAVMQALEYARTVEEDVNAYLSQHAFEIRLAKQEKRHRAELAATNEQHRKELEEMRTLNNKALEGQRKVILERDETILQMQNTINAMSDYHQSIIKHGGVFYNPSDNSSPESDMPVSPGQALDTKPAAKVRAPPASHNSTESDDSISGPEPSSPTPKKVRLDSVKRRFRLPPPKRISTSPQGKAVASSHDSGEDSTPEREFL